MEAKFVNKTAQTERNLREMQFAALGKLRIILYTVVAAFAILTSIMLFASKVFDSAVILLLMGLLLLMLAFLRPILGARQQYKRNAILTDEKQLTPTELRFYDDKVVTFNPTVEKEISFTYDKFKKYKKTAHLHLIVLPQSLYLMVDKSGFEVGAPQEFEAFIKEKIRNERNNRS